MIIKLFGMFGKNLFSVNKLDYAKGKRPKVDCILCAVSDNNKLVDNLTIYEAAHFIVSVNLYPYNTGHIMIFPKRHLLDIREYTDEEILEIEFLTKTSMNILEEVYKPSGFNVGYNIGENSGASIPHLHRHIIPRYYNEIGVIDIIGGAKIIVEDPVLTKEKLIPIFREKLDK
jgi:ATP adenylyltransferase